MKLGKIDLKNNIVLGPHRLNFPEDNIIGARRIAFYKKIAEGGVGTIITESMMISPNYLPYEYALNIYAPNMLTSCKNLVAKLKNTNAVLIGNLNHYGGQGDSNISRTPLLAPSAVMEVNSNEIPRVMDIDDINEIKKGFLAGAQMLALAGFDGIEINADKLSLIRQFISPLTNFRAGDYGGSLENRLRLLIEIITEIRSNLGEEIILGIRLCSNEYAPWGGLAPEDFAAISSFIEENTKIDYIACENGSLYSLNMAKASASFGEEYAINDAAIIAKAVNIPVIAGGSISTKETIEVAENNGITLVDMTRALIADPMLPNKLSKNEPITPCMLCNTGCYTHSGENNVIACAVNPEAGNEIKKYQTVDPKNMNLAVVGAGIAGINAAIAAAQKGAKVTIFEKSNSIGGKVNCLKEINGFNRYAKLLDYYLLKINELNITLNLNTEFTSQNKENFDRIIIAIGAKTNLNNLKQEVEMPLFSAEDILKNNLPNLGKVVVFDTMGDNKAVAVTKKLKSNGNDVVLITPDDYLSLVLAKNGEFSHWYREIPTLGINTLTKVNLLKTTKSQVILEQINTKEISQIDDVVALVAIIPPTPEVTLWEELQNQGVGILQAGDCAAARNILSATIDGYLAGIGVIL